MKKRILSLVIISVMLAVFIPVINAQDKTDNEKVTLIVEVKGDAALETDEAVLMGAAEYNETDASAKQTEKIISAQEKVKSDIKSKVNKKADFGFTYTNVLNGFSVTVNKSDIEKIKSLPNVENVYISGTHKRIEPVEPEENSEIELLSDDDYPAFVFDCCYRMKIDDMHNLDYKGQGQAIVIIDSELDINHENFSAPIESPKYSKADISKIINEKNLNVEISANQVWKSNKIPFAYSYANGNADVYNTALIHGTHVTGIAAGNNDKRSSWKYVGVAPESQIIFMGISDSEGEIPDEAAIAALDDASKMDVAAINMSWGAAYVYTDEAYEKAINTAVEAGILVSASAGNEGGRINEHTEDVDCSSGGVPDSISAATSVASSQKNGEAMSTFSSWGTNASLELKPEITAVGSSVFSSYPDDKYEYASGTSMAAPHITGAAALMRQYIEGNYQGKYENPAKFIENLMMSTAQILYYDEENKIPYSPRNQGAGQLDLKAAATTPVILKGDSGKTKISLKDKIGNSFNLEFTAENFTDTDVTYDTVELSVITDKFSESEYIENYFYVDGMKKLSFTENLPESVTIPANSSTVVSCTVTLDETDLAENSQLFTNGFFLEGYVMLSDSTKNIPQVNIPYMGFYGDWTKAPVFDKTYYENDFTGHTYLGSDIEEYGCDIDYYWGIQMHSCLWLGENIIAIDKWNAEKPEGDMSYFDSTGWAEEKYAGYSPNGDGVYDFLCIGVEPKRTAGNAVINIENTTGETVYELHTDYLEKSLIDCVDLYDEFPDDDYIVTISGQLPYEGAERESIQMRFYVDTEYPTITAYSEKEADGTKYVDISATDNRYLMGFVARGNNADGKEVNAYAPIAAEKAAEAEIDVTEIESDLCVFAVDYAGNATKYTEPTPTPTISPSPSPTPTVKPTESPTPPATPTVEPTKSPSPTPSILPTPSISPSPTPSPSVTPTPTPIPKTGDRVEFKQIDNVVSAKLIFEETTPPTENDIWLIVAYRENGELKRVENPHVIDMTTSFIIPKNYEDCEISVYIWDRNMKPLMTVQEADF